MSSRTPSEEAVCLYGWLACPVTELRSVSHPNNKERASRSLWGDGRSCVHALWESFRRAKASPNRRTGYWYTVPSRANLRKRLWCGDIWKYASFKSTDGVLHPSWAPQNSGCKCCSPACLPGLVLSLLFQACCIALVSGPGYFEAMLETAPRCWNRVVCTWIKGRTHALSHRVTSVRFSE